MKKIGEGGMGSVYLARDLSLEREVAIKIIAPELARNPGLMVRFRVEAIAQTKLNHTNIVTIHSFDQEKDIYYIVMEYMEGKTLKAAIKEKENIPVIQTLKIFSQLLAGIAYAHSQGVVHRDVKPSNIFLKSITKDPDHRFQDVKEFEREVKQLISSLTPVPETPTGKKKTPVRPSVPSSGMTKKPFITTHNKQQLVIALALIAILLIVVVFLLVSGGSRPSIQTSAGPDTSGPEQSTTGRHASEMPRILQPDKPTTQEPPVTIGPKSHTTPELPSITGIDNISEILKKMDWLIKKEYYDKAVNLGKKTINDGTVSGQIYLAIAQAYYCDGKKDQALIYYMKALELDGYLNFSVGYQYKKDIIINGILDITKQNIYFKPSKENLNRYAFSIPMTRVKRVSLDRLGDIGRKFKKKENREDPVLIIRDKKKKKYNLQVRNSYKKSRSFVKDIINTLRKM